MPPNASDAAKGAGRRRRTRIAMAAAALCAASAPAAAHHSTAMFDQDAVIELTGTVVEFQYTNPHSWLIVDVEGEDGETARWGFELDGPTTLQRQRIGKGTFPAGATVTVRGRPHIDGRNAAGWMETIIDGESISPAGRRPAEE